MKDVKESLAAVLGLNLIYLMSYLGLEQAAMDSNLQVGMRAAEWIE